MRSVTSLHFCIVVKAHGLGDAMGALRSRNGARGIAHSRLSRRKAIEIAVCREMAADGGGSRVDTALGVAERIWMTFQLLPVAHLAFRYWYGGASGLRGTSGTRLELMVNEEEVACYGLAVSGGVGFIGDMRSVGQRAASRFLRDNITRTKSRVDQGLLHVGLISDGGAWYVELICSLTTLSDCARGLSLTQKSSNMTFTFSRNSLQSFICVS